MIVTSTVVFNLDEVRSRATRPGAAIGIVLGVCCLVAVVLGIVQGGAPVAALIIFSILGIFFGALGVILLIGGRQLRARAASTAARTLLVEPGGLRETTGQYDDYAVPWVALRRIDLVAQSNTGYNVSSPYDLWGMGRRTSSGRGTSTLLSFYPLDPERFHADFPLLYEDEGVPLDEAAGTTPFVRSLYLPFRERDRLAAAIAQLCGGRFGGIVDRTVQAPHFGPQPGSHL